IHIGYPKAGSTFLQAWFEGHPELGYTPGGLGGFHNVYEICRGTGTILKYYVTSYEGLCTPNESAGAVPLEMSLRWNEHTSRIKKDQADVCTLLKSLYPESRIIIVTRGFKAMIVSGYSQYVRAGGVLGASKAVPDKVMNDAYRYVYQYYDFNYLIQLYSEAFGEHNLIILPYELLRDDQDRFLRVLEQRLDLKHADIKLGRLNPSLSPEELYWYPAISRVVAAAASRLGPKPFEKIYGWYVSKTLDNKLRPFIKVLQRLNPDRKITEANFSDEILTHCSGKASRLRDHSLYAPYAKEYLWDE
ncbi:MAG TPA: hypothetical protein VJV03_14895, partial [Pyrinomonadaceae bacterium]|nr:hypothetical protein [Pyrinomonadaceae bacterium]